MDYVALVDGMTMVAQVVCPIIDTLFVGFIGWAVISLVVDNVREHRRYKASQEAHRERMRAYYARRYPNGR